MFHIIRGMEGNKTAQITQELDRTYKTVLAFAYELQDVVDYDPEFDLTGVCEADEVYVVASEKRVKQESPRERGLKKGREKFETDKPSVVTLVRHFDGRVRFFVRKYLQDVDEEIVKYGDEDIQSSFVPASIPSTTELTSTTKFMPISSSITTNTTSLTTLTQTAVKIITASFATGCKDSVTSQSTTYEAI